MTKMLQPTREELLTIVFPFGSLSVPSTIREVEAKLAKHNLPADGFASDSGKPTDLATVSAKVQRSQETTFHLTGQGFEFDFSSVRNHSLEFLEIKFDSLSTVSCDVWVESFMADPNFVHAWLADGEYEHWQNAYDPLQYTSAGRPFAHLPIMSNGLPYPLEQEIIDTSANPGRRILRDGYIEAVGALMWLGKQFWPLTQADMGQLTELNGLRVSELAGEITRVEAAKEPFVTAGGQSGAMQRALRSALFPNR